MNFLIKKKPNELIIPENINFTELIKNSNTITELNIQSEIINILTEEFTEPQQQLYVANLYMYLNFHPTNDFPINLENVFGMIGFANKGNAKKTLESNFTINEDYKIIIAPTQKKKTKDIIVDKAACGYAEAAHSIKNLGGAGLNKENIMLNIETMKSLCMIAKTFQGKEMRKYYMKLENIHNKIIKKEMENKNKLLQEKDELLLKTQKQLELKNKLSVKRWYDSEPGDAVYGLKSDTKNKNTLITLGKSKNIKGREVNYFTHNQNCEMFYGRKCYNAELTEKVLHHILDKHRVECDKEWFEISEELAIYIIDIVCDFLDSFIIYSELFPKSNVKENLINSLGIMKNLSNETKINHNTKVEIVVPKIEIDLSNLKIDYNDNEKLNKFINEYCEIDPEYYVLSYELLGAFRIWSRGLSQKSRKNYTKYMKEHYKSKRKLYPEHNNSKLLVYLGIRPKELKVVQENDNNLPKYEEFILTECKYNYMYRIKYSEFINKMEEWYNHKYPDYNFNKEEKVNMEAYINRHFLKERINNSIEDKNVPGIWGIQMKDNNKIKVGINTSSRRKIVKIDINTKKIVQEYNSVIMICNILNMQHTAFTNLIKENIVCDDKYIYKYLDDCIKKE